MFTPITTAAITILSVVAYQIGMKSVPIGHSPIGTLLTFYVTALVCTLIAAKFFPISAPDGSLLQISWAAVMVGVAIVGIEVGFLMMYRNNWHLATAPLVVMGSAAVILLPIALFVFKQPWSSRYFFGLVLCTWGLYLLVPRDA